MYFEAKDLKVGYDGAVILSELNIQIDKGQILTLIGPNGAGKTTFLKTIIRQLEPISGVVSLENEGLFEIDGKSLSKKMAVVLTNPLKTEYMTVEDVVDTGRYPYTGSLGLLSEKDHRIVGEIMERIGIIDWKTKDYSKLSDGQKQRVLLARALAQEPEILILDEPTSFLDIKHKVEFLSMLEKLVKEEKLTVIMSLHEVELARTVSDFIACFKEGRLDRIGKPEDILGNQYLLELFDVNMQDLSESFQQYMNQYIS